MKRLVPLSLVGALAFLLSALLMLRPNAAPRNLSQEEFTTLAQSNLFGRVRVYFPPKRVKVEGIEVMLQEVRGTFYEADPRDQRAEGQMSPRQCPFRARVQISDELMKKLMKSESIQFVTPNSVVQQIAERLHLSRP
jgi:hypothetical protein